MNIEELKIKIYKKEKELNELKEQLKRISNYESIIILNTKTTLRNFDAIKSKIKSICGNQKEAEELGIKILAYEIKGNKKAFYFRFEWEGTSEIVSELENYFRISNDILKFITVRIED